MPCTAIAKSSWLNSGLHRLQKSPKQSANCSGVAGKSPYLLFTNRHEIRRIDLVKRDYSQVVSTQKNAVALDLDVANNRVFWCDRFHRKIYR